MIDYNTHQRSKLLNAVSRRELFSKLGLGAGALALASLLAEESTAAEGQPRTFDLLPKAPHFPGKAKRVIYLFQNGGQSHVDLFDPKPMLTKHEGEQPQAPFVNDVDAKKTGKWLGSPFKFERRGQSGQVMSELMPRLGEQADEIAIVRSMVSLHENHEQAIGYIHTGAVKPGRPTMGSWITYALGTENQNLPAYVVLLNPSGLPVDGVRNWTSGWIPPIYQGLPIRATDASPILNLASRIPANAADRRLKFIQSLNRRHRQTRRDNLELDARIAAFELAARMQLAAPDAMDLGQETAATRKLYGLDQKHSALYGRELLMARRLIERGVRFVQVMMAGQPWDTHNQNESRLRSLCAATDAPVAGLLADLKQRGLLDDTLVIWTGEFGRTPFAEGKDGRDHHKRAFSLWLAGAGVKGGASIGATDDFGYEVVDNRVDVADLHATILHLLGLDWERLTFKHGPRIDKLTDVNEARVVEEILA